MKSKYDVYIANTVRKHLFFIEITCQALLFGVMNGPNTFQAHVLAWLRHMATVSIAFANSGLEGKGNEGF